MDNKLNEAVKKLQFVQKKLAVSDVSARNGVLAEVVNLLDERKIEIFEANAEDISNAAANNIPKPLQKRLLFNEDKLEAAISGIRTIIKLCDPVNSILEARELDEGLILKKVSCPIGVIGMIFESRPDALIQIASLCLKSGNGIILKGGSEAAKTNRVLADIFSDAAVNYNHAHIQPHWIYLVETREQVREMLELHDHIDLIIPRGSNEFVKYIMENTHIPVLGHADGICHSYIHKDADVAMAIDVTVDAKSQYPAVCNALETLLVHAEIAENFLPKLVSALESAGVELRGDEACRKIITCGTASEDDWSAEYLDLILSIRIVHSMEEAIDHIHTYGSGHTDSIITASRETAEVFMSSVDSADVMWNCSTRFSDGYRYGLGAEVGISTLKIHARGPVGLEGLMTYKWKLYGQGQKVADYSGPQAKSFTFKDISWD